jgi:hypothetical protein
MKASGDRHFRIKKTDETQRRLQAFIDSFSGVSIFVESLGNRICEKQTF